MVNTHEFSYGSQTPHLPRKPLPKQGDACSFEDIQGESGFPTMSEDDPGNTLLSPLLQHPPSTLHRGMTPLTMRPSRRQQAHWVLCRGRFKTIFLSPSPGLAWVRHSIWQEKSSLLILASSSPPRQRQRLNRYGKLGSREVRAGRRCL